MPRHKRPPVRQLIIRVPETTYAELITLNPDMTTGWGTSRYGSVQQYFLGLMHQDLERRRAALRAQAAPVEASDAT